MIKYIPLLSLFIVCYACSGGTSQADASLQPIVTVKDQTLYKSELIEALPSNLNEEDSIAAAKAYIDMWINDKLLYDKAKQNVIDKNRIESLVEEYRKSLIVNSYQEQLANEYLSKSTSENDLKNYYEQNKDKFKLKDNIIKGLYLKIPVDSKHLSNFEKWYKQGTDAAVENIEKNTLQNAVAYEYFYDRWVNWNDVLTNIPTIITDAQQFLNTNKNLEVRDSSFVYLLNIKEYRLTGTEPPFEYVKTQLTDIFIEHRKASYLKKVQTDLYEKALSKKEIKFYNE